MSSSNNLHYSSSYPGFTCFIYTSEIIPAEIHHEVSPDILHTISTVGHFQLPTFTLKMKREKQWQQQYKSLYFYVPGPDVNGPYYLVTRGHQIGVLVTWPRTAPSMLMKSNPIISHIPASGYIHHLHPNHDLSDTFMGVPLLRGMKQSQSFSDFQKLCEAD
ncbi:hypothetical protein V8B97DRAFT_2005117 [Scleroderma yunnanense]